tara:strand:- start:1508 stop:2245 length:738 start_codon:yes stop_codon:yes gene_type:complete
MIKIDTVYQKVLALANKEQRGYLTPQDFNLFADHAQKEIFEQYFYDLNQFKRVPGNSSGYANMVKILEEKISLFEVYDKEHSVAGSSGGVNLDQHDDVYRLTMVRVSYPGATFKKAEQIQLSELNNIGDSPLTRWSKQRPVYTRYTTFSGNYPDRIKIYPYPESGNNAFISYIKKPVPPNWNYQIVNEKPFFLNNSESINFTLHPSEESELVYRILALAGVQVEKPQLTQTAMTLETAKVQQEKQ